MIGLTVVAIGTSFQNWRRRLQQSKNGHDLALGNVIGSNMFNTLAVVGIAGAIIGISGTFGAVPGLGGDGSATLLLLFSLRVNRIGRINRLHGISFLAMYVACIYLVSTGFTSAPGLRRWRKVSNGSWQRRDL